MRNAVRRDCVTVAVVHDPGAEKRELLAAALEQSGFWDLLRAQAERGTAANFTIAVKPDLDFFEADSVTGADPALVETLIALLRARGYGTVVLIDGRNQPDGWLHNRGALCVPDIVGYHFESPAGHPYDVAFAADDPIPVPVHPGDDSACLQISQAWLTADVRISIGKNKTDDLHAHAGCVYNLLGLIPRSAVASQWTPEDRCVHLLRRAPPHFALLDAMVSSDGISGSNRSRPVRTDTLIASRDALLVDWVAALKSGADPYDSRILSAALKEIGLPESWAAAGDMASWQSWASPSQTVLAAVRKRGQWPELDSLARAVLQPVDREHFPFRDMLLDQLNATVSSRLHGITDQRLQQSVLALLQQLLALIAGSRAAYISTARKQDVIRSHAPIMLDVHALPLRSYDVTEQMVEEQARALIGAKADVRGFRARSVNGHIHFHGATTLDCSYDDFVQRVQISRAIQYMNDYVGGQCIGVSFDRRGRVLRQVERNVYLPQPNWISAFGGEPIDVEKLERIRYAATRQTIWWRTVRSANESAHADDGSVSFARTRGGQTEVRIFARQRFRQPPVVAAAQVQRFRGLYSELVSDAYGHFFDGTIANLRAAYEGREHRIGKDVDAGQREDATGVQALLSALAALVSRILGQESASATTDATYPLEIDAMGFQHFAGDVGPRSVVTMPDGGAVALINAQELSVRSFLVDLGHAVARDVVEMAARSNLVNA